jgi:hypothetical protein
MYDNDEEIPDDEEGDDGEFNAEGISLSNFLLSFILFF